MPQYITIPFETDPELILNDSVSTLQDFFDGWQPSDGNLDYWLMQIFASEIAELMDVASAVPQAIFRVFGSELMSLPPIEEAVAHTYTTWTMIDNRGYIIPQGTQVSIDSEDGTAIAFETVGDVTVPSGSTATPSGAVLITAIEPGSAADGLGGIGADVALLDPLVFVSDIVMTEETSGGTDAETDDAYLNRLATKLRTMAPRPILPMDFAILARDIPEVRRAVAIDLYNPADHTYGNERMVTIAAIDATGANVSSGTKTAIQTYLDNMREINFVVNTMDPNRTTINVTFTVVALPSFDHTIVANTIITAIENYLDPLVWGWEPVTDPDPLIWTDDNVVRYNEMIALVDRQEGVKYVSALTINGGTVDVTMTGPASLPTAGTITGTAT